MNNKNISINKQELLPDVYCANIFYNKVENGKVTISMFNISETAQDINVDQIRKISYENDSNSLRLHTHPDIERPRKVDLYRSPSSSNICEDYA